MFGWSTFTFIHNSFEEGPKNWIGNSQWKRIQICSKWPTCNSNSLFWKKPKELNIAASLPVLKWLRPRLAEAPDSTFSATRLATTALTKVSPVPVQDTPAESTSAYVPWPTWLRGQRQRKRLWYPCIVPMISMSTKMINSNCLSIMGDNRWNVFQLSQHISKSTTHFSTS